MGARVCSGRANKSGDAQRVGHSSIQAFYRSDRRKPHQASPRPRMKFRVAHPCGVSGCARKRCPSPIVSRVRVNCRWNTKNGAQERTRTSTPLRELAPEASASANSATWAFSAVKRGKTILPRGRAFVNEVRSPAHSRGGESMSPQARAIMNGICLRRMLNPP